MFWLLWASRLRGRSFLHFLVHFLSYLSRSWNLLSLGHDTSLAFYRLLSHLLLTNTKHYTGTLSCLFFYPLSRYFLEKTQYASNFRLSLPRYIPASPHPGSLSFSCVYPSVTLLCLLYFSLRTLHTSFTALSKAPALLSPFSFIACTCLAFGSEFWLFSLFILPLRPLFLFDV